MWIKILVCFLAGAGAGIGTGFAGMSAAAVIGPMLATFLNIPTYQAVGIGLASDVLASAISAYTYKKNKNLDVKNALPLLLTVLCFTVVGSLLAKLVPDRTMNGSLQISLILIGLKFILKPARATKTSMQQQDKKTILIKSLAGGTMIGLICGFIGAGGGMMLLLVLTSFLDYEMHIAVGTSVFIMAFTALTGSVSHFVIGGMPDVSCLVLCIIFTFLWARIAAVIANRAKAVTLSRIAGIVMIATSVVVLAVNYL